MGKSYRLDLWARAQLASAMYHSATPTAFTDQNRLTNGPPAYDLPELNDTALSVFGLLRDAIVRLQQGGALGAGDPGLMSITAWATLHGLVMLSLDGQTAVTSRSLDSLTDAATELLLTGMGAVRHS